jgi:DNA-binding response OmpR family regulator
MTAHNDTHNLAEPGRALHANEPGQARILYLGRSLATADLLRTLLDEILYAPTAQDGAERDNDPPPGITLSAASQFEVVTNQKEALRHLSAQPPTLVLVETSSKAESRLRFCQALRQRLPNVTIVAVAGGRGQHYTFPFNAQVRMPVEAAQARAALRTVYANAASAVLRRGSITLDMAARRVSSPKGEREMTPKQCALLELLMRSERVVRRADIMRTIWETSYLEDTRTLDVHIHWLREMIEPEPAYPIYLITLRGVGYRFVVPDEQA